MPPQYPKHPPSLFPFFFVLKMVYFLILFLSHLLLIQENCFLQMVYLPLHMLLRFLCPLLLFLLCLILLFLLLMKKPLMSNITLIDSGLSDCFIDEKFVIKNNLSTYPVTPLSLRLFDGTTNSVITKAVDTKLCFASGKITQTTFYVTLLDGTCSMVLGHNWLTHHNPLID